MPSSGSRTWRKMANTVYVIIVHDTTSDMYWVGAVTDRYDKALTLRREYSKGPCVASISCKNVE
jgi:hypothetical protein